MEKQFLTRISNAVEYIGTIDCTISGSRNGQTPFFFKHIIDAKGKEGFKKDVACCIALAEYLTERLPSAWRNQNSLTVVFPKPSEEIITKWQLATSNDISHVVVLPHVTTQMIDEFIEDILQNQT